MKAMPDEESSAEKELIRRWVKTWQKAGPLLEEIRRAELESVDTKEAVRQLFGDTVWNAGEPAPPTSGLIEQQRLFALLRDKNKRQ